MFWKQNMDCGTTNYSQNYIDLSFYENGVVDWCMPCFYGYPERSRRKESWDLIRKLAMLSDVSWCIIGDFNDLLYSSYKRGNHPHPSSLMEGFG